MGSERICFAINPRRYSPYCGRMKDVSEQSLNARRERRQIPLWKQCPLGVWVQFQTCRWVDCVAVSLKGHVALNARSPMAFPSTTGSTPKCAPLISTLGGERLVCYETLGSFL
ncbi:hypothetical protein SLA2020_269380 [Shorea laevis]